MLNRLKTKLKKLTHAEYKYLLTAKSFKVRKLAKRFPAKFEFKHKQRIYQRINEKSHLPNTAIGFSRWQAFSLPKKLPKTSSKKQTVIQAKTHVFKYAPSAKKGSDWYVNFAFKDLFFAYPDGLLAQSQWQVMEHPILASLREAMLAKGKKLRTVENGKPTPVLIKNVPRQCIIDTSPSKDNSNGLYGYGLAKASAKDVEKATTVISPTFTNIIAMQALSDYWAVYNEQQIQTILTTAYTGFKAAKLLSKNNKTIIHSGFWGCGAYGGNKVMMLLVQMIAAKLANIDKLVLYVLDSSGSQHFDEANKLFNLHFKKAMSIQEVIKKIESFRFEGGFTENI